MDELKFVALDGEDLAIVSAHLQDAVLKVSDVIYRPQEKRLVLALNRFDWESAQADRPEYRRRRAALRFERVLACKSRNIDLSAPETVLELVGIEFHAHDAPAGTALLLFGRGAAIRLDLECLECELTDLGPDELGTGAGTDEG